VEKSKLERLQAFFLFYINLELNSLDFPLLLSAHNERGATTFIRQNDLLPRLSLRFAWGFLLRHED